MMQTDFEELYLQSEQAIKDGDLIRAKGLIEHMLMEDPRSAIAHNSMGWFYRVQFEDYEKAELPTKLQFASIQTILMPIGITPIC